MIPLVAICATALAVSTSALSSLEYGMEMSVRAYDAVCWYEYLKQFPNTKSKKYNECAGQQKYQMNQIQSQDFFKKNPDKKEEYFGKWTDEKAIEKLPEPYPENCRKFLKEAEAKPEDDESDALNDGGKEYPYKAYCYCLLHTMREKNGIKAIEAVKNEKTHSRKHWMEAINERDNEFRARHESEPLKLVSDLNDAAKAWADTMASECNMYHSKNNDTGRQWHDEGTGESLFAGGGEDDKEISAYQASDGWYEEIADYPYPDGYKGDGSDALFMKIGHFTQTVWKETKYVGYGYAYNPDCKDKGRYTRYVAARYSPAGNGEGKYYENVNPPKDDSAESG